MSLLDRLKIAFQRSDNLKTQLFAFLGSDEQEFRGLGGRAVSRDEARALLRELIPAVVEVRGICRRNIAAVASAPHVSFDNWSEYFCNRAARELEVGWVIARNFRDQDSKVIPAPIGRHLHVNRPTESTRPGGDEFFSERAETAHRQYLAALNQASGRDKFPLDLLVEFHSQMRTPRLEIATVGFSSESAEEVSRFYDELQAKSHLPELAIEPIHALRMTAEMTKTLGSLRPEISLCSWHIEIPREFRRGEPERRAMSRALNTILKRLIEQVSQRAD